MHGDYFSSGRSCRLANMVGCRLTAGPLALRFAVEGDLVEAGCNAENVSLEFSGLVSEVAIAVCGKGPIIAFSTTRPMPSLPNPTAASFDFLVP
jgi:hypothetical protein